MKIRNNLFDFIIREWLVFFSAVALLITSLFTKELPTYSIDEFEVLFILYMLFIAVKGLQLSGAIGKISRKISVGRFTALKLTALTFFLSMIITNDIALLVIVPLTLMADVERKDILIILEALAANAGSALTPIGNPQNLFIYWSYGINPIDFISTIFPFSAFFFLSLAATALFVFDNRRRAKKSERFSVDKFAYVYSFSLLLVFLTVLHILPVAFASLVFVFAFFFDRRSLKVDYALLLTFFFFFGLAENLKLVLAAEVARSEHIFLFSALVSQIISNVPAALLFAKFTDNWQALLWGVNAGGFGSLFGSLANLIAYKLYVTQVEAKKATAFTVKFLLFGYIAFALSVAFYFWIYL